MEKPFVTILIPTYKRAHLIGYVLDALTTQTYGNFEVLVVLKPSGDETERVVKEYSTKLQTKLILQTNGYVLDALNLGFKNAKGQIIIFLDDDAIPPPDFVQSHVESYQLPNVGGVAGDVLLARLDDKKICKLENEPSDLLFKSIRTSFAAKIALKVWNAPLEGLEDYLFYISKAGVASMNGRIANVTNNQGTKSLLGRGVNMSVLSEALGDFRFPNAWILGFTFEQYLGWNIWRKGYSQVFNPKIKVHHLEHGQSLSRNFKQTQREILLFTEQKLLFYRLWGIEPKLSLLHRTAWIIFETLIDIKRICVNRELHRIAGLKSTWYSTVIGSKLLLQKKFHLRYSPLPDLEKLRTKQ
jgi:glycosyltransferase involved in cell wall biosynthesis